MENRTRDFSRDRAFAGNQSPAQVGHVRIVSAQAAS
jgi:hypothetical protein